MVKYRGPNRGSFTWGGSTRNTPIERFWVDVGAQFARRWRAFFTRLERLHGLDWDDPQHIWLLHLLFLHLVDADCKTFQSEWNRHPISRRQNNRAPLVPVLQYHGGQSNQLLLLQDMRFLGEVEHGVYADDFSVVHPQTFQHYGDDGKNYFLSAFNHI
ncbi:hypothetical protein GGX14DRAFT_372703 [Mycena pura]|uniref:Integrase core domain-containing protein n=1 Tax=Mycena pura TaxID=153505 RepID=A0AAD6V550_9AGAR|nr:hypothetical protein GGX14DRAFT_372703 [Mycena pura]